MCSLLAAHPGWVVCGEAADGREAVEKTRQLKPDVIVLDIGMPNLNGLEAARQILRHEASHRILILTITDSEQVVQEVLKAGAKGYLLKSDAAKDLVTAVEALAQHRTFFNSRVGQIILEGTPAAIFADLERLRALNLAIPEPIALAARLRAAGFPIAHDAVTIEALARELLP